MSEQDQIGVLSARVEALEVEVATLTRALLSLGSGVLAGGQPGPKGYMAWHDHQMNPPAPPEPAPQVESQSGSTEGSASDPTSAASQPGSSQEVSPPVPPESSAPSSPKGSSVPLPNTLPSTGAPAGK